MTSGSTFGVTSLSPGDSAPAPSNRLGVGHLLLWTATTAVVFATLVTIEERHVARFSGRNVQQNELSVRIHRAHYWLGLAVAPAYGASIAAMALASWRLMIQRPGFPTQPGHWLLIAAGVLPIAIGAAILNTASTQRLAPVMICWLGLLCLAIVVATAANFVNRPPCWSRTFRLGSWGLILIAFQLLIAAAMASGDTWFFWYVLNLLLCIPVVAAIFLALVASLLDLRSAERWDTFHWIGLATFWIIVGHPIASVVMVWLMEGRFRWILV